MPPVASSAPLHQQTYSLDHQAWVDLLATTENLLIIQDLDGVCMDLVNDPMQRQIEPAYVAATQAFGDHFYVLTNGEHIGLRGINGIIEQAFGDEARVKAEGLYLPGLAAGGVQWQTRWGQVEHPGVSEAELAFLGAVPGQITDRIQQFFQARLEWLGHSAVTEAIESAALDNMASPTVNLNILHDLLQGDTATYLALQQTVAQLMEDLLTAAAARGLGDSFFVHYAPNHGRGPDGKEVIWYSQGPESGTTDFQFMLRGAIKEAGVLALLNRYYAQRTGTFPLGEGFSVRQAPHSHRELLDLVVDKFDPKLMPTLVGVGDTVTSAVVMENGQAVPKRGGSDRNFLYLIQEIGQRLGHSYVVTYVDSSGGELKNRRALQVDTVDGVPTVTAGPGDPRDTQDPLVLNVVFPGGYRQYSQAFQRAAKGRTI